MGIENIEKYFKYVHGSTGEYVLDGDLFNEPSTKRLRERGVRYVPFLDYGNNLLKNVQAAINTSPTTSAIIRQKTKMALGDGFKPCSPKTMLAGLPVATPGATEQAEIEFFLGKVNAEGQDALDLLERIYADMFSFGNCFIEVQNKGAVWSLRHLPIYICRPATLADNETFVSRVGVSDDFEQFGVNRAKVELPIWPKKDNKGRSVIHIKTAYPNFFYWGFPEWFAARLWAEIEYRVPRFNVSKLANGYFPSAIVSLFQESNEDERREFIHNFKNTFTDTGNNSKMFVHVVNSREELPDVKVLETKNEGEFLQLMQMAKAGIITAHGWTAALAGEAVPGRLGTNQQIRDEYEMVMATSIKPMQKLVLDSTLNPILKAMGFNYGVEHLDITPVSFKGSINPAQVLTQDEQREILGYPALNQNQNIGDVQ